MFSLPRTSSVDWTGLATFVTALTAAIVALYNAFRAKSTDRKVSSLGSVQATHTETLGVIQKDVNNSATEAQAQIKKLTDDATNSLRSQIDNLESRLSARDTRNGKTS